VVWSGYLKKLKTKFWIKNGYFFGNLAFADMRVLKLKTFENIEFSKFWIKILDFRELSAQYARRGPYYYNKLFFFVISNEINKHLFR
jgi:hypothetical protein